MLLFAVFCNVHEMALQLCCCCSNRLKGATPAVLQVMGQSQESYTGSGAFMMLQLSFQEVSFQVFRKGGQNCPCISFQCLHRVGMAGNSLRQGFKASQDNIANSHDIHVHAHTFTGDVVQWWGSWLQHVQALYLIPGTAGAEKDKVLQQGRNIHPSFFRMSSFVRQGGGVLLIAWGVVYETRFSVSV